ncbi:MAG: hypothetical protein LCI03_06490 [Actinobacteria bacterium]|nr:hypothetical protein [Actinomycetota bacterium]
MKNHEVVNIRGQLPRDAVRLLADVPGVVVEPTKANTDVVLRAGQVSVAVEVKAWPAITTAAARQVVAYAAELDRGTTLVAVARTITEEAREQLTAAGIGCIDATGAIRLDLPGLYIWRDAQRTPPGGTRARPVAVSGKAGLAAQAMLREPERPWTVQDLAEAAEVSVGLVHRLFVRLEADGLLQVEGTGPRKTRRVSDPGGLLDVWAAEMRDRDLRTLRAHRLARNPEALAATLSKALTSAGLDHAVTGAAAAARLAPFVTAIPVTEVWVPELSDLAAVADAAGAREVSEGHNVVLRSARDDLALAFRGRVTDVWLADTFRVYLDLRADPRRGREQADRLRAEVLGL